MKKKMILLFICLIMLALGFKKTNNYSLPLLGKLIVIDPGHGGKDPGTMYKNIYEKDLVLAISLYLEKELNEKGASTILTRSGDYDLSKPNASYRKKSDFDNRIKIINEINPDLYLSIHLNYLHLSQYYGGQIFYNQKFSNNYKLAIELQDSFNHYLKSSRKIKYIPESNYMYEKLTTPGVLIECGFLSNPGERSKLVTADYQQKIAEVIVKGIINYYN